MKTVETKRKSALARRENNLKKWNTTLTNAPNAPSADLPKLLGEVQEAIKLKIERATTDIDNLKRKLSPIRQSPVI